MKSLLCLLATALFFFAACSSGEKTTPNGYKLINHTSVSGPKAQIGEYAYVHVYIMQDDSVVQSTRQMGRTIPINVPDFAKLPEDQKGVGKANPIADAVSMMAVGDSVTVIIPIDEQMRQAPQLKNAKTLAYNIVLVDIKTQAQYDEAVAAERKVTDAAIAIQQAKLPAITTLVNDTAAKYKKGELKDKLKTTGTGLSYLIVEAGTGAQAQKGSNVQVQYYGALTNGTMFDNSFGRGAPFKFQLGTGQVIPGWDEGIALLKEGDKAVFFIPSEMGYGAAGTSGIPPNSELVFYVELEKTGN